MTDRESHPRRSIKKYAIAGAIGVIALAGILIALAYMSSAQKTVQDTTSGLSPNPSPQGSTAGAGKDNPGPGDSGGTSDTNPKPIPSPIVAADISISPNPAAAGTSVKIAGSGFNPNQQIAVNIDNVTSLKTDPSTITTDSTGSFNGDTTIPRDLTGNHKIAAVDQTGKAGTTDITIQ
jgi:hypothetical protein